MIIGNILIFIGSVLMIVGGYVKSAKLTVLIQSIQMVFMGIGNIFLGGFTAAFSNLFSITRNMLCYKEKLGIGFKTFFIIVQIIISLFINNLGFIGFLPIIASIIYTIYLGVSDDKQLKIVLVFSNILWLIHDLYIQSYVAIIFDILTILSCCIAIFRIINEK